jgi:hypothetical protein
MRPGHEPPTRDVTPVLLLIRNVPAAVETHTSVQELAYARSGNGDTKRIDAVHDSGLTAMMA